MIKQRTDVNLQCHS